MNDTPSVPGRYLVLAYEWVGLPKNKPEQPTWRIREWSGLRWERTMYYWDTGGMENLEVVRWQSLPEAK